MSTGIQSTQGIPISGALLGSRLDLRKVTGELCRILVIRDRNDQDFAHFEVIQTVLGSAATGHGLGYRKVIPDLHFRGGHITSVVGNRIMRAVSPHVKQEIAMDDIETLGPVIAEMIRTLLGEGATSVVVILTDADGAVYSQWAIPRGMDTEPIGQVFEKINDVGDVVLH